MLYYMGPPPRAARGRDGGGAVTAVTEPRARPRPSTSTHARLAGNPWGKPRFLGVFTWAYILWSIVPVLSRCSSRSTRRALARSGTRSRRAGTGGTRWSPSGTTRPSVSRWSRASSSRRGRPHRRPIGVLLALGLARWRGRGSGASNFIMLFPLVTPEIVMGVSLLLVFTQLFTFIHTGTFAQILGHVTFSISFVVVIVRARLFSIGRQYEEAAADLGASPFVALTRVLLPLLTPAIVASAAVVFAISADDFVISQWLSKGGATDTVPIQIYAATRAAPLPSVNAIATIMMGSTLLIVAAGFLTWRVFTRGERRAGKAAEEFGGAFNLT